MIMIVPNIFLLYNLYIYRMTTITELSNELEIMEKRLEVFKKLKVNHKIMEDTHNHALYSIAPGYFQSWARWWQGENQKKTYEHLDIYFTEFLKLLDKQLAYIRRKKESDIVILGKRTTLFINSIIPGIHTLKSTYPNYEDLRAKIDSIILVLLDFNNEFRQESYGAEKRWRSKSFDM